MFKEFLINCGIAVAIVFVVFAVAFATVPGCFIVCN